MKRRRAEEDDIPVEETENLAEDEAEDLGAWTEGFVDDGKIYIYRLEDGERVFCGKVIPPITPEMLQGRFGGGRYEIVAYRPQDDSGRVRIAGRRRVTVAGLPTASPSPTSLSDFASEKTTPTDSIRSVIDFYRTVRELEETTSSRTPIKEQMELMSVFQSAMTAMLTQQMTMLNEYRKLIQEMKEEKFRPENTGDVILGVVKEVSSTFKDYLQTRQKIVENLRNVKRLSRKTNVEEKENDMIDYEAELRKIIEYVNARSDKEPVKDDFDAVYDWLDDLDIRDKIALIPMDMLLSDLERKGLIVKGREDYIKRLIYYVTDFADTVSDVDDDDDGDVA